MSFGAKSLVASATRVVLIAVPALLLARLPSFQLNWVWHLSVASVFVQLGLSLWFLKREFARRLDFAVSAPAHTPQSPAAEALSS